MDAKRARELLPQYATADTGDNNGWPRWTDGSELPPKNSKAGRMIDGTVRGINRSKMKDGINGFLKRNMIAILVLTAFALEGWIVAVYTENRVSKEVRATVEAEMRQGFQDYLDQQEADRRASAFVTGDASRQAAIADLGESLAVHVAGLRMDRKVTKAGAETYCWVDIARLLSGHHGATIEDVLNEPKQVEAYTPGHAVREEDREIAMKVASAYINGEYPNGFTQDLQYAEINADGSVTARNKWKTDSTTVFWRIAE